MTDALPDPRPPESRSPQPLPADLLRVGDAERQQAVTALGEHYAAGRLDQDEYDTRIQTAYAAKTRIDLQGLFGDLPEPVPFRPTGDRPAGSPLPGWEAGRNARDRTRRRVGSPVIPVLMVIAIFLGVSLLVHFPVVPLLFLLIWVGAGRRRGWGGGPGDRMYR
jgi:Domain of unknown function (DUF1707)